MLQVREEGEINQSALEEQIKKSNKIVFSKC